MATIIDGPYGQKAASLMAEALDRIAEAGIHHERCQTLDCGHGFCGCFVECPTGIALKLRDDIGNLMNLAVAGPGTQAGEGA